LITGFKFGNWRPDVHRWLRDLKYIKKRSSKNKKKLQESIGSKFRERVFPEETDEGLRVGTLETFVKSPVLGTLSDEDAVRAMLLYVLSVGFLGKEKKEKVTPGYLLLVDDLSNWNRYYFNIHCFIILNIFISYIYFLSLL